MTTRNTFYGIMWNSSKYIERLVSNAVTLVEKIAHIFNRNLSQLHIAYEPGTLSNQIRVFVRIFDFVNQNRTKYDTKCLNSLSTEMFD